MNKHHLHPRLNARFFHLAIFVFLFVFLAAQVQAKHLPLLFSGSENKSLVAAPVMDIDLSLLMGATPANPPIYSTTSVTVTVLNNGSVAATGVKVKFPKPAGVVYSGGNEWTTSQGNFAGFGNEEWTVGSVPTGGTATLTVHYFLLTASPLNAYAEVSAANETDVDSQPNNGTPPTPVEDDEAVFAINSALLPDLTFSEANWLGFPTSSPGGERFYDYYLENQGNGAVNGDFSIRIWVSTDQTLSADDFLGKTDTWSDTPPNWFYQIFVSSFTLPANLSPGQYYLIFKVDAGEVVPESNENNNIAVSSPFTVESGSGLPDFYLNSFGALQLLPGGGQVIMPNSTVTAGNSVAVFDMYVTGSFPGAVQTYQYSVALRLSADANFDASDLLLVSQERQFTALNPNYIGLVDEIGLGQSVIPANTPPGNYYLLLKYDSENAVAESVETNNVVSLPIVVEAPGGGQIDLSLALLQTPAAPAQWNNYTVKATLSNAGPQAATGVKVKFAKPAGVVYTGGNEFTASQGTFAPFGNEEWNVGSIPANGSAMLTVSYFLLQTQAPVAYAQVIAANETDGDSQPNNGTPPTPNQDDEASTFSIPPNLTPDLTIADLQITNAPVQQGQVLNYNFDLSNIGTGAVPGNFTVKSYLSTDNVLSANDIQDGTITTGNYGAGFSANNVPGASTIPAGLAAGNYFLIVKMDADGVVPESNENNNEVVQPFTVTGGGEPLPDLTAFVQEIIPSEANCFVNQGGAFAVFTIVLVNNGTVPASAFKVKYFISTDNVLSNNDVLWSTESFAGLNPISNGGPGFSSPSQPIPVSLAGGKYFVIIRVDADAEVAESNENNNQLDGIAIQVSAPSLVMSSASGIPVSVAVHGAFNFTVQLGYVANGFPASAFNQNCTVSVELQPGITIGQSSFPISEFSATGSVSKNIQASIPASVAPGNYTLQVRIQANLCESTFADNFLMQAILVTGGGNLCDDITLTPGTGSITISGATAPHVLLKVFHPNWTVAFECLDGACSNPQVVSGLNGGAYYVEIKLLNAGWEEICTKTQTVHVIGGGSNLVIPDNRFRIALDKFYPNPASHWLNVVLFSPKEQEVTLDFYNQQGRRIHTLKVFLEEGRNTVELPVSDWKSGTYNVIARGEGLPAYGRFMKVWEE